jgi:hypothetical protein
MFSHPGVLVEGLGFLSLPPAASVTLPMCPILPVMR